MYKQLAESHKENSNLIEQTSEYLDILIQFQQELAKLEITDIPSGILIINERIQNRDQQFQSEKQKLK